MTLIFDPFCSDCAMAPRLGAQKALGPIRRSFAPWLNPSAVPLIRFENVVKRFGDFTAVDGVSLDVHSREFFALLGPSGCGKTTLMRMLAGFEEPTSGRITLAGQDLAGVPPYRRPVNMMFQSYALFPHMTVEQNVAFGLKQDGLPRAEIAARVKDMLRLVKLEPFASRKPHHLSGGQRQRVALARSLAKRPKVLLLDEPLAALDKKLREETQFELMDLQQELGLTFLIVTHDQEEAMMVADRIGVMNHGRLAQVATPAEIYEQPNSRYVAEFIGDINIFDGAVTGAGGGAVQLAVPDAGAELTLASESSPAVGATLALAIRPEKVRISVAPPPEGSTNVLRGEVWDIAYLGDWTVFLVKLAGVEKVVRVSRANATRTVEQPIAWEDQVFVHFAPDAGVLLPA
jgi:putrescine transport system ATP-binding protein